MKIKIKAFFFFAQITLVSVSVCQIVSSVVPDLIWKQSNWNQLVVQQLAVRRNEKKNKKQKQETSLDEEADVVITGFLFFSENWGWDGLFRSSPSTVVANVTLKGWNVTGRLALTNV